MLPKPLRYPIPGPGPFRERSTFQVLDGLRFLPRPGDLSGPRSVPERRAITHERSGHGTVCSGARTPRKGVSSPEPRKGSRVGTGEGVSLPKPAISLPRTFVEGRTGTQVSQRTPLLGLRTLTTRPGWCRQICGGLLL